MSLRIYLLIYLSSLLFASNSYGIFFVGGKPSYVLMCAAAVHDRIAKMGPGINPELIVRYRVFAMNRCMSQVSANQNYDLHKDNTVAQVESFFRAPTIAGYTNPYREISKLSAMDLPGRSMFLARNYGMSYQRAEETAKALAEFSKNSVDDRVAEVTHQVTSPETLGAR